jgi:hypothetical protein
MGRENEACDIRGNLKHHAERKLSRWNEWRGLRLNAGGILNTRQIFDKSRSGGDR